MTAPPKTITAFAVHYTTLRGHPISNPIFNSFVKCHLANTFTLSPLLRARCSPPTHAQCSDGSREHRSFRAHRRGTRGRRPGGLRDGHNSSRTGELSSRTHTHTHTLRHEGKYTMTEINTQRQLPATLTPTHPSQEAQSSNDRAPALDDKTISDQKQHYTLAFTQVTEGKPFARIDPKKANFEGEHSYTGHCMNTPNSHPFCPTQYMLTRLKLGLSRSTRCASRPPPRAPYCMHALNSTPKTTLCSSLGA
jgi:hypothetical protein